MDGVDDATTGVAADCLGVGAGGVELLTEAGVGVVEGDVTACEVVEGVDVSGCGVRVGCGLWNGGGPL